jgi:hypothetical protein
MVKLKTNKSFKKLMKNNNIFIIIILFDILMKKTWIFKRDDFYFLTYTIWIYKIHWPTISVKLS